MSSFTTRKTDRTDWISAGDLIGRCSAAARMALKGANWSAEDRADVAAAILCRAWSKARETEGAITSAESVAVRSSVNGGPRVNYSAKNAQKSKDTVTVGARETYIRADVCAWSWLLQRAADERRHMETGRAKELESALSAPVEFDPFTAHPADETGGTPWGARRKALELGRELGVISDRVAPGPVWTFLYAVSRAVISDEQRNNVSGGLDRETVAIELELDRETVKKHIQRALVRIPANRETHTAHQWAEALHMPDTARALKPSRSRTESADIGTRHAGPRENLRPADHAPVTVRRSAKVKRANVDAWTRGAHLRPAWTRDLDARTAKRLETAARIRLERAAAKGETATAPALYGLAR